jgi:RNA polymerase-binding transcription factor
MMHMHYFTIEQRETLQAQLQARAAGLRDEISAALRASRRPEAAGLASRLDEIDVGEFAGLETSLDVNVLAREVRELRETEGALKRLHTPEYGLCADCGVEIPFARLHANPAAARCAACQSRFEEAQPALRSS